MALHATQVIKRPLITEKCTWQGDHHNRYSFEVHFRASKPQIRKAIEQIYEVRVMGVATQVRKGKYLRTKFGVGKTSNWKRATIQVHPDDRIDLF